MEKVILAYSGGLDTSVILKYLSEKKFEVIAYVADVGQNDDFNKIEEKVVIAKNAEGKLNFKINKFNSLEKLKCMRKLKKKRKN